ncbi:MAG: FAD-dependent oxidoreductase [Planctomycetes bacterium]|nr:FAD-dependent oxidoreductase [Planctomycetota bacterium]
MTDCCIIGGGIVGLSIARELAGRGLSVRVVAREGGRNTASWAAAGILPPAPDHAAATPNERLTAWSDRLHRRWARELLDETGIDNGLRACGGLYVGHGLTGHELLRGQAEAWRTKGVTCDWLAGAEVAGYEPAVAGAVARGAVTCGYALPDEAQIRPPRHLEALEKSCALRGVEIAAGVEIRGLDVRGARIEGVIAPGAGGRVRAEWYVLAAGAWSGGLAERLGVAIDTRPIRGQIAQLRLHPQRLCRVVNRGLDYLVPRADGTLLVGSTLEDAGFDASTDDATIGRLVALARDLLGDLPSAQVERAWAGLRPGSADGLPTIGPVPAVANAVLATGHFRAGLHQSTGTAALVADLITGRTPPLDPIFFAADRAPATASPDAVAAQPARVREPC